MDYPASLIVSGVEVGVEYAPAKSTRSTVRIQNGKVLIKLSRFAYGAERDEMVEDFLAWAEKKLSKMDPEYMALKMEERRRYEDGARIRTHNKVYELSVTFEEERKKSKLSLEGALIELKLPLGQEGRVQDLVEKAIIKDQQDYLEEVVNELNQMHFQENYGHVRWKRMGQRFGSCSSKRNLNFAFRLLFTPKEVFRYVCVHELAHLKEFNHSKRFWALVEAAMPEYKQSEQWLKRNGFMLG